MADCVGCGYCCLKVMCTVGIDRHGKGENRCPYLIFEGDRYLCKLVRDEVVSWREISAGFGCSSSLNNWRQDVKFRG